MGAAPAGADPVGATEIAQRVGVGRATVEQWTRRHSDFPAPRWTVGGRPAWDWSDLEPWLRATHRLTGSGRVQNAATRLVLDLAAAVLAYLTEHPGWVRYDDLRETFAPTLPPEREVEVADEVDAWNNDDARGSAWQGRATGRPDYGKLTSALAYLRADGHQIEEGYRDNSGELVGRSFRLVR